MGLVLLISASQVAGITGKHHHAQHNFSKMDTQYPPLTVHALLQCDFFSALQKMETNPSSFKSEVDFIP
jgi:hypothetical protein